MALGFIGVLDPWEFYNQMKESISVDEILMSRYTFLAQKGT